MAARTIGSGKYHSYPLFMISLLLNFRWIVVQPGQKNPKGRYLERVGYWLPRKTATVQRSMIVNKHRIQYWLGVGATCTNRVHRILERFDFVAKQPVPFGSQSVYEKPEKEYKMEYYKKSAPKGNNKDLFLRQQL
jgi:ribosomal protein S16